MSIVVRSNEPNQPQANEPVKADEGAKAHEESKEQSAPEGESSEQKEASDSETEELESKDESEEPSKEDESESGEESKEDKPKKKSGFQRRVDKLNAAKAEAQREAEYWKRVALEKGASEPKKDPVESKPLAVADGKPLPESFETHQEWVEAVADWKAEQKLKERDQRAEKSRLEAEQAKLVKTYLDRKAEFSEKTPDFEEVIESVDGIQVSPAVQQLIIESDIGPEISYALAKNPKELKRISSLSPLVAAREIGKLEAKLVQANEEPEKESKKITKASTPLAPVGTGGKGSVTKSIRDPGLSQQEYERMRREQMKRRQA